MGKKILDFLEKASKQHHVVALRDGMIGSVPIILVGSTFLLLASQGEVLSKYFAGQVSWLPNLEASGFIAWYTGHVPDMLIPYRFTMGLLGLYIAFTVAHCLARQYHLPPLPQAVGAVAALLVAGEPVRAVVPAGHPLFNPARPEATLWMIPQKSLGAEGIFLGIFLAILMVEVSRAILKPGQPKPETKQPEGGMPQSVVDAFASFLPMLLVVMLVYVVVHFLGFDLQGAIVHASSFLAELGDTLGCVLAVNLLLHLFGVAGVHGISVINAVMLPIWQGFLIHNADLHSAGQPLQYVTAYPFWQWFIWIGGAGVTLAPTVLLFTMKHPHLRNIGKISIVPALFNVNEPFLFGIPVVANPILAIPFILAPLACGTVAFFAVSLGLVTKPFLEAPWVLPCFLGAALSCQDLRAVVLVCLNLAISAAIWWPFLKLYERRLYSSALGDEKAEVTPGELPSETSAPTEASPSPRPVSPEAGP